METKILTQIIDRFFKEVEHAEDSGRDRDFETSQAIRDFKLRYQPIRDLIEERYIKSQEVING